MSELRGRGWLAVVPAFMSLACSSPPAVCSEPSCFDASLPPLLPSRDLDLLFVIDNSGTAYELQPMLRAGFPAFTARLAERFGSLPSLHIGIILGNLGAGGYSAYASNFCAGEGDGSLLQNAARLPACEPQSDLFIEDIELAGERRTNYPSESLESAFNCIVTLGSNGCAYQQHLLAIRRALDGSVPANAGFLREAAYLAIVVAADDEDCSASDVAVFDPSDESIATLGPRGLYRCWRYGWLCGGEPPIDVGTYEGCVPNRDSPYLIDPHDIVSFLSDLKGDPRKVVAAALVAPNSPARIILDSDGERFPENICPEFPFSPNVRDRDLASAFGERGLWIDACNGDLGPGLTALADVIATAMGH